MDLLLFLAVAFALGFKHSYDADHLVAVSNVLTRSRSVQRASRLSLFWSLGHMVTAAIITTLLFLSKEVTGAEGLAGFEVAVAAMLIAIGIVALALEYTPLRAWWRARFHRHPHRHGERAHEHEHAHLLGIDRDHGLMMGIGVVHGLASNDELLVLLIASLGVTSLAGLLLGVGVFTMGVVLGMVLFAVAVNQPVRRWGTKRVHRLVNTVAAVLSLVYGALLLVGFQGFNPFG